MTTILKHILDEEYNKYKIQIEKISKLPIFQSDLYKFNLAPIDME